MYEKDCRSELEEKCQTVTETITQQQCQMINEKICNTINEQSCNTVGKPSQLVSIKLEFSPNISKELFRIAIKAEPFSEFKEFIANDAFD